MKRYLRKAEDDEKWREKTNNSDQFKKAKVYPYSRVTNDKLRPCKSKREETHVDLI